MTPVESPMGIVVTVEKDPQSQEAQTQNIISSSQIRPIQTEKVFKLELTDRSVRYTHLGNESSSQEIITMIQKWHSGRYASVLEGEYVAYRLKPESERDSRSAEEILTELSIFAAGARILYSRITPQPQEIIETRVEGPLSRFEERLGSFVWVASSEMRDFAVSLFPELEETLIAFPRIGLPPGVFDYIVSNATQRSILSLLTFSESEGARFIVVGNYAAEVYGVALDELRSIAGDLLSKITLETRPEYGEMILVKAWSAASPNPSYDSLVILFIRLKSSKGRIQFVQQHPSEFMPKIVRNSLWTTPSILAALLDSKSLLENSVRKAQALRIGSYQINQYPLSSSGVASLYAVFGKTIDQAALMVRPFKKAEVVSTDQSLIKMVSEILEENEPLFNVIQRSLTSIVFESLTDKPYLTMMKVYFTLRYLKGVNLVSELNPQKIKLGRDALEDISAHTDFGGGKAPVQIITIDKSTGRSESFLIGDSSAVEALVHPLPTSIQRDIVLQPISPNVLGRRVGKRAYAYLTYLLGMLTITERIAEG